MNGTSDSMRNGPWGKSIAMSAPAFTLSIWYSAKCRLSSHETAKLSMEQAYLDLRFALGLDAIEDAKDTKDTKDAAATKDAAPPQGGAKP